MKDFKTIEIPPEHKVSLGATFKYLEDVAKKEEDTKKLMKDFEELKQEYLSALPKALASSKDHAEQLRKDFEKRKKEYDNAFLQGLTPEQLKKNLDRAMKGDFRDDWQRELDERKKMYRASGRGIDFNKERTDEEEDKRMQKLAKERKRKGILERLGWKTKKEEDESGAQPSNDVAGVYLPSEYGADIEAEQVFQQELHGIVDEMKVKLVDEKKILEGTLNPEYGKGDWGLPHIEKVCSTVDEMLKIQHIRGDCEMADGKIMKNELSQSKPTEEQWKSDSPNGSLITDLTPTSTRDSSSSSFIAEDSNPSFPTVSLRRQSTNSLISSCSGKSDDCGIEIDAMNEYSECTVPMISVAMLGMPNEVRWSPPPRSTESLVPSLLGVRS